MTLGTVPGHSRLLMILLRMVWSSRTLISMSWGETPEADLTCARPSWTPVPPAPPHGDPTYLPRQLSEEGLEVLINLLFGEDLLCRGGEQVRGALSPPTWLQPSVG